MADSDTDTDAASVWDRIEDADADSVADTVSCKCAAASDRSGAIMCKNFFFWRGEGVGALLGALDTKK